MEKNKKRAQRRFHQKRMLRKAENIARTIYPDVSNRWEEWEKWKAEWARRHADNLKACSCWLCCSPRENGELTMQERRVNQRERYCEEID